jgi:excinuclease ABC subunit A
VDLVDLVDLLDLLVLLLHMLMCSADRTAQVCPAGRGARPSEHLEQLLREPCSRQPHARGQNGQLAYDQLAWVVQLLLLHWRRHGRRQAGERGGRIVFDGTPDQARSADTLTGAYLGGRKQVGVGLKRLVTDNTPRLILEGARGHNLKNISVEFPLQRLVCVTGVSGSGKSTLMQDILAPALLRQFGKATETPGEHDRLLGADHLNDVVFVDQSPIGKTARSNPASYVGAWDAIRELFADAPLARERSYTASKFSFNSGDGRCPTCGGSGFEHVEMQFLSDVYLRCPDCDGKRYRPEILEVRIERVLGDGQRLNVADVLELTVSQACEVFRHDRDVLRALQPIIDVGLE